MAAPSRAQGILRFNARKIHATERWTGDRAILIAYTPGDLQRMKEKDWACLEELGFWLEPRAENQTVDFSVEFGIRWSPDEFVHEASKVQHASSLDQLVPLEIREAIRRKFQKGEAITEHERAATIRRWVASANLLIEDEEKLHSGFSEHWRQVLKHKRMLLFRKLLEEVGHDDQGIFKDMCNGFSLVGQLPESGVFKRRLRPAEMLESDLRASAKRERVALLATIEASGDPVVDEGVLKVTTKEVAAGFVDGRANRRFDDPGGRNLDSPVRRPSEGGRRPIDNYQYSLPFILSVAMRGSKAQQAHDAFNLLAGNAAFRLVGIRLRGERMHLQPLAQHIAKMAAALRR